MMPEAERECFDEEDFVPWDCDLQAPGESDVADLLDDGEDDE